MIVAYELINKIGTKWVNENNYSHNYNYCNNNNTDSGYKRDIGGG